MGIRLIGPVYLVGGQDYNMVYLDWPAHDCNTYLLDTGDTLVLFDCGCGDSLPGIMQNLHEMDFDPREISHLFLTHAHLPHAGAAADLQKTGVEILAAPAAARVLRTGGIGTAGYHYGRRFNVVQEVTEVEDGETVTVAATEIRALHLPGHSPGSIAYEVTCDRRRMLFCGDVVRSPMGRQWRNRPGYDGEAYRTSLVRLLDDPPDVLYPGHGPFCLSRGEHWIGRELVKLAQSPT